MADILTDILSHKQEETKGRMQAMPITALQTAAAAMPPPKPFAAALRDKNNFPVIAEIKKRSPSKKILCENFSPTILAQQYADNSAACLSVLTDEKFFGGCQADLLAASASQLPILRKDFILNEWQVVESRAMGADAILLIVAAMPEKELHFLASVAQKWGMEVLIETHTPEEARIVATMADDIMIGVNNRNLKTFQTDLQTTADLIPLIKRPEGQRLIVSESGISTHTDIEFLQKVGADAFLIGESLLKDPTRLMKLFG